MSASPDPDQEQANLLFGIKQALVESAEDETELWYDDRVIRWTDDTVDDEHRFVEMVHLVKLDGTIDLSRFLQLVLERGLLSEHPNARNGEPA